MKISNSFNLEVEAKEIIKLENRDDFLNLEITTDSFLILGECSNTLFTKNFDGTVILVRNKGIEILNEDDSTVSIRVSAGENWNDFVEYTVDKGYLGPQNLAFIPGNTGATPVQNVGAYGVEISDFLEYVTVYDLEKKEFIDMLNKDCKFGYRDSIFKNELKGKIVIYEVVFKLDKYKGEVPEKYFEYGGIKEKLEDITKCSLKELFNIIVDIRKEKLPLIEEYGSCGSTFKNPEISTDDYEKLKEKYPELPSWPVEGSSLVKIPAAHILEKLGWKNKRVGSVGTWIYHPLIVTNYGGATGDEVLNFIHSIQEDFFENTGIQLDTEINIIS